VVRTSAHDAEALRTCAARMRERLRAPDVLAHLGSGTFAAVLPECTAAQAESVFGRVQSDLRRQGAERCDVDVAEVPPREMPEAVLVTPPTPQPGPPPVAAPPVQTTPVQTTIDRDEPILSDLPNLAVET